jgi:hypothetical protein
MTFMLKSSYERADAGGVPSMAEPGVYYANKMHFSKKEGKGNVGECLGE